MARMTGRERLRSIFEGRVPDRPAVKIWGAAPGQEVVHPAFLPIRDLAVAITDLALGSDALFNLYCGVHAAQLIEHRKVSTASPEWEDVVTTYHTPEGDLREIFVQSTSGHPGYTREHLLKEPADLRKLLAMPYTPYAFDGERYRVAEKKAGDAGLAYFRIPHPMAGVQSLIGSENFAIWSVDADALLQEAIGIFAQRARQHAEAAIQAGIRSVFGWAGPELCIPPLMPPDAFERYVFNIDKPMIDRLHEAGGLVWVHCHGKMSSLMTRFQAMGVDVLNPVEPPPMGDVTIAEAFVAVGDKMGLEGGIESHDLMTATPDTVRDLVRTTLKMGCGKRFVLCPCSGYMENPEPTEREIGNWRILIEEGVRYANTMTGA